MNALAMSRRPRMREESRQLDDRAAMSLGNVVLKLPRQLANSPQLRSPLAHWGSRCSYSKGSVLHWCLTRLAAQKHPGSMERYL